jgi:hypothetical protein
MFGRADTVHHGPATALGGRTFGGGGDHVDEPRRLRARQAADVHRVAHLAIEGVLDRPGQHVDIGVLGHHDPRAARAVQAHWHTVLPSNGTELGDRRSRAACDRQGQPRIGEQRPPRGVRRGIDQPHTTCWQTGLRSAPA